MADITSADDFHLELDKFLNSQKTRWQDKTALSMFLKREPSFSDPRNLSPIDEMDQRIVVMRDIERGIQSIYPDWRLTAMHASIMMAMPLDTLQASSPANTVLPLGYLRKELQDIQNLVAHCNTICIRNHIEVAN